jgi:hypothetical protein
MPRTKESMFFIGHVLIPSISNKSGGSKVLSNEEQRFSRQKYWRGVMHAVIEEERSKAQKGREDA